MSRFKTELCNNLIELGSCKYGDRCHYAHGAHELRSVSRRHPKYRTERCKNFELTGKCPFGPRCSYVHPKPDLDSMIEQLSKYMKHTKAPKPDSEDDDETSLFTARTNTNTDTSSTISTCDSFITSIGEENKENQLVVNYEISNNSNYDHFMDYSFAFNNINTTANITPSAAPIVRRSDSSTAAVSSALTTSSTDSCSTVTSSAATTRTPLSTNNRNTNLSLMNISNNFQVNLPQQSLFQNNDQTISKSNSPTTSNSNRGNNLSLFESTSFESNKKLRLISTNSNINNTASNPFGIRNPLSDYLNTTNVIGRSPLQPNKQFYTRF